MHVSGPPFPATWLPHLCHLLLLHPFLTSNHLFPSNPSRDSPNTTKDSIFEPFFTNHNTPLFLVLPHATPQHTHTQTHFFSLSIQMNEWYKLSHDNNRKTQHQLTPLGLNVADDTFLMFFTSHAYLISKKPCWTYNHCTYVVYSCFKFLSQIIFFKPLSFSFLYTSSLGDNSVDNIYVVRDIKRPRFLFSSFLIIFLRKTAGKRWWRGMNGLMGTWRQYFQLGHRPLRSKSLHLWLSEMGGISTPPSTLWKRWWQVLMNLICIGLGSRWLPPGTPGRGVQGWRTCAGAFGTSLARKNRFFFKLVWFEWKRIHLNLDIWIVRLMWFRRSFMKEESIGESNDVFCILDSNFDGMINQCQYQIKKYVKICVSLDWYLCTLH